MHSYIGDDIKMTGGDTVYAASATTGRVFISVNTGSVSFGLHLVSSDARALAAQLIAAADHAEGKA